MPLEIRKNLDGTLREFWYGRYEVNGKRHCENLQVKIKGVPPRGCSLKLKGDLAFELSRVEAQDRLDRIAEDAHSRRDSARLVEKLYEIKTGERMKAVPLAKLPDEWAQIPRRREPNERYASQCKAVLERFATFMAKEFPKVKDMTVVTRDAVRAFLESEADRGNTSKTWNDTLKLLRATFKYLLPAGAMNPFFGTPTKDTDTVFRKPFTPEELKTVLDAAKKDDFIRPIIVTGVCSAMRRGDCCLLKWKDVDLEKWFITVKTSKTGQTVDIPIFPMLYDELVLAQKRAAGSPYCFPQQAEMYLENPDGITWRVKKVLVDAFMAGKPEGLPELSADETRERGLKYLAGLPESDKTARMKQAFAFYMDGKNTVETMAGAGVSKGSVSGYLNEIEAAIGCRVVRGRAEERSVTAILKTDTSVLGAKREDGTRRASIRDFHSFRVTWVTLALTAGMPLELVQRVTGHKTTDVVLKHYFRPGREDFRRALENAMPQLFMEPYRKAKALPVASEVVNVEYQEQATPAAMIRTAIESLEKQTARNWKEQRDEALQSLRGAAQWVEGNILHEKPASFAKE